MIPQQLVLFFNSLGVVSPPSGFNIQHCVCVLNVFQYSIVTACELDCHPQAFFDVRYQQMLASLKVFTAEHIEEMTDAMGYDAMDQFTF